jgi:hypothetical protein
LPQTWGDVDPRNAPPISDEAAALNDYTSPNQAGVASGELEEDPSLSRLRGTVDVNEEVLRILSWTTLKD